MEAERETVREKEVYVREREREKEHLSENWEAAQL